MNGFDKNNQILACFVDLAKAFDSVWRPGLMYKISKIGVSGRLWMWIKISFMIELFNVILVISLEIFSYRNWTTSRQCTSSAVVQHFYNRHVFRNRW